MRKLTINRKKTFVACTCRIFIYIETNDLSVSDKVVEMNKKHFNMVGTISNGKTLTVEIPNETVEIIVACSAKYPLKFSTCHSIPSGEEDIVLFTKPIYSPFLGNPFIIEQLKG